MKPLPGSNGWSTAPVSLLGFGLVGAAAFLLHFSVVSVLVPLGLHPLLANVAGFAAAFSLSFVGHSRLSFPAGRSSRPWALQRFFVVAVAGFLANESLYGALLGFTPLGYRAALVIVLVTVAASTYLASRYWAFAHA